MSQKRSFLTLYTTPLDCLMTTKLLVWNRIKERDIRRFQYTLFLSVRMRREIRKLKTVIDRRSVSWNENLIWELRKISIFGKPVFCIKWFNFDWLDACQIKCTPWNICQYYINAFSFSCQQNFYHKSLYLNRVAWNERKNVLLDKSVKRKNEEMNQENLHRGWFNM